MALNSRNEDDDEVNDVAGPGDDDDDARHVIGWRSTI